MDTETPQLAISRVFDAPRELVYRAFTDPDHLAAWWGPIGNSLPRDQIEFDVRPGGYQRWIEVSASEPDLRVHIYVDLTDVADGELLEGVMHVTGQLQGDDVFASTTDLLRSVGTFLYGRRLYETMAVWETNAAPAAQSDLMADFATAWQAANKVVYSTTLAAVPTAM